MKYTHDAMLHKDYMGMENIFMYNIFIKYLALLHTKLSRIQVSCSIGNWHIMYIKIKTKHSTSLFNYMKNEINGYNSVIYN
jgi:hypothetical protein